MEPQARIQDKTAGTRNGSHRRDQGPANAASTRSVPESRILHCEVNGLSVSIDDIQRLMQDAQSRVPPLQDYVLRRDRESGTTHLTMEFHDPRDGPLAHAILRRLPPLNGRALRPRTVERFGRLPPKYEPLHISPQSGPGRVVTVNGLPFKIPESRVRIAFRGFDLVDNREFQFHCINRYRAISTWMMRCKTESEAQRLAKTVDHTFFEPNLWGQDFPLTAEVFY